MTADSRPGQLLFTGFHGKSAPKELLSLIAESRIGGVVLFARNIQSPDQLRALTTELLATAPPSTPLLIAIDQEGGRVQRMRHPWTEWPPMRKLGDHNNLETTREVARAIARELADCSIHLNFAPVVDVDTNPENPIIGDRSFGRDAARVAAHTQNFIEALQGEGVAACAKHFPGHGDTATDSHLELPCTTHNRKRLDEIELPPFRAAVAAGVASVMTAHVVYRAVDERYPATLSRPILDILRHELAYEGVIFSDDLDMKAMTDHFDLNEQLQRGIEAGIDAFLICNQDSRRDQALRILEALPIESLRPALRRVAALKRKYARPPLAESQLEAAPPYATHSALIQRFC